MRGSLTQSAALAFLLLAGEAGAQDIDPLLSVHDGDPLALASAAARLGDAAVIARFSEEHPLALRLQAVTAARFLRAPELALPALAELAAGRDPDLAPAAMRSLLWIARSLSRAALDAREHDGDELTRAVATLSALAVDASAREDLRRGAMTVVALLSPLGG